ncbi:MAG TPA: TetR/AcrR family transcriptional regulator [Nocardioidaceae bacterium]|nr:TetR/AcrR family transcriptional regulator [Nocardioidaceae bacterium]
MVDVVKWVDNAAGRRATKDSSRRAPKRAEIVLAATDAIEEHGLGVNTAQIAERAGVARPHVYRHFDSKDDLDDEVARYAASELVARVRPTMVRSGTPAEIIRGVVAESVGWAGEHPNLYRFMADRQQTKAMHHARLGRNRFLGEIVEASGAYLRTKEITQDVPDGIMAGLMGMVDASIIWWLDHKDEQQREVVERLTRQIWVVLKDMLEQLGLSIDDETVLSLPDEGYPSA